MEPIRPTSRRAIPILALGALLVGAAILATALWPDAPPSPRDAAREAADAPAPGDAEARADLESGDRPEDAGEAEVRGTVVDLHGAPIVGARVRALRAAPRLDASAGSVGVLDAQVGSDPDVLAVARSDAAGEFLLRTSRSGAVTVDASADGFATGRAPLILESNSSSAVRIVLAPGATIRGRVRRMNGAPVVGAKVVALVADRRLPLANLEARASSHTDRVGRFEIAGLEPRAHGLCVLVTGRLRWVRPMVLAGAEGPFDIVLVGGARLEGTVRNEDGQPLSRAHVEALVADQRLSAKTDESGRYAIEDLSPGKLRRVSVFCPEYAQHPTGRARYFLSPDGLGWLESGRTLEHDVVLTRGSTIHGRVVRSTDGTPCAGAEVTAVGWFMNMRGLPTAVADGEGRFRLEGLDTRRWVLVVRFPGFGQPGLAEALQGDRAALKRWAVEIEPDRREERVDLVVEPLARIEGLVRSSGGEPVPVARIVARRQVRPYAARLLRLDPDPVAPDDRGRFRMSVAPGVALTVEATADGFAPSRSSPLTLSAGESVEDLELVLEPAGRLTGTVIDEVGAPVVGAVVQAVARPDDEWSLDAHLDSVRGTLTLDQGRFAIGGLPRGSIVVRASAAGWRPATREADLAAGSSPPLRIRLERAQSIRGIVLDEDGRPVPEATVASFAAENRNERASCTTGGDGRFTLSGLAGGAHEVRARCPGYLDLRHYRVVSGTGDIRIHLTRSLAITGRVVDADGRPVARARVIARSESGAEARRSRTGSNGRFCLDRLRSGTYSVEVRSADSPVGAEPLALARDVAAGIRDLEIHLR
jgi:protocatechuate 3,4-dioxygenase beta subunit